jgi:NAD(P)-dependent dehydrogenase (short-subunit alcohol dehydrogenase family)
MQSGEELELTDDGVERTFATNCLGHFALAELLKAALVPGAPVVITASQSHNPADRIGKLLGYRGGISRPGAGCQRSLRYLKAVLPTLDVRYGAPHTRREPPISGL